MPATQKPPPYLTTGQRIVIVLSALVMLMLGLIYQERAARFDASQRALARTTSAEVANQVAFILTERQRLVRLFAEDHLAMLQRLQREPDSPAAYQALERSLRRSFPDFFAVTITDNQGKPLIADFEGYIGDICLEDIQSYARTGQYAARIHPNNYAYHFDIMADWPGANGRTNMLMVSFAPTELGKMLRAIESAGHQLMLISTSEPPLIEVTAQGARDRTPRTDYRLTSDELKQLLVRQPVAHSRWSVADFLLPEFEAEFNRRNRWALLLSLLAVALVTGAALVLLRREERQRQMAERAREELFSVVTHEMRTPVTALSGTLALLGNGVLGELPPPLKSSLPLLERNAERLRRLIDDLLESRRIEAGQLSLEKKDLDLAQSVQDSIDQLRDYAQESAVCLEFTPPEAPVWVHADPLRLQQISANLVSNAAKFSPRGGTVRVCIRPAGPGLARVCVRDDGPGIAADFQPHVFEKFARGTAQPNRPIASTGLGLSIVKALVEAHGGHVGFDSTEGQGSTFYFDLPTVPAPAFGR